MLFTNTHVKQILIKVAIFIVKLCLLSRREEQGSENLGRHLTDFPVSNLSK